MNTLDARLKYYEQNPVYLVLLLPTSKDHHPIFYPPLYAGWGEFGLQLSSDKHTAPRFEDKQSAERAASAWNKGPDPKAWNSYMHNYFRQAIPVQLRKAERDPKDEAKKQGW